MVKDLQFRSPLRRYFFPRFVYNLSAAELCFLCECLERTRDVPGSLAEIGCANGSTALFLNKYMQSRAINKRYYALDTFAGFVAEDVDLEVTRRGKRKEYYTGNFEMNDQRWVDGTMQANGIASVTTIRADVNTFDFGSLGSLALAFLDVDLYRPMRRSLPAVYEQLSAGGILVADDCKADKGRFDGAHQAYTEFIATLGVSPDIRHGKLGIIVKPG
jgi:SAM-dependent methyltransferase